LIAAANLPHSHTYQFIDYEANAQQSYDYYLESVDLDGSSILYNPIRFIFENSGEDENPVLPEDLYALGNYPNPFNPSTTLRYSVPQDLANQQVSLKIYNVRGQLLRTLVAEKKAAGNHTIIWDGRDAAGKLVSSGIFYSRLAIGQQHQETAKLIMLK
ncbi:MAG: FlgD immunoglobulin-like domain containing protein, partial [Candidatus Cloacimonadales bacterium]